MSQRDYRVIIIIDKAEACHKSSDFFVLKWPSPRPTRLRDFIFFFKLVIKYRPILTLGQFGSTNLVLIVSYLTLVSNRLCYWHSLLEAIELDTTNRSYNVRIRTLIKKILLKNCSTKILTNSNATINELENRFGIKRHKIAILPILISGNQNDLVCYEKRKNQICFVARFDRSKNHETLIRAIPYIIQQKPDLKFVFAGKGPLLFMMNNLVDELNIRKNVIFLGHISMAEVLNVMSESLIHINATLADAFGLVNIEALSCGTPIMGIEKGGMKDILIDGVNGKFFDFNNAISLSNSILEILNNWQCYSVNAFKSFSSNYDKNNIDVFNSHLNTFTV